MGKKTWLCTAQMFILLCILVWLDEILDLPHLLLGASSTPVNWRESLIETVLIAAVGLFVVSRLIRDIAERNRAEEALQISAQQWHSTFDAVSDAVCLIDLEAKFQQCNKAMADLLGKPLNEIVGGTCWELVHGTSEPIQGCPIPRMQETHCRETLVLPVDDRWLSVSVDPVLDEDGNLVGAVHIISDITERQRAEEALRQRNRELALLSQASQAFTSTLDLDQVLANVLEEIRRLLDVTAASVWLIDRETDELVCQQVIGPQKEIVHGWRLAPGQGLAGRVAHTGESLIVPDVRTNEHYFQGVDQQTGLPLRSILTVPLRVRDSVIGVAQVVDTKVDRFQPTDLRLVESLAMPGTIAIENAQLYEQARRDAETRSVMIDEINHRVKNNLTAIIGLLYAERRYAGAKAQAACQSIIEDMVSRLQGLATVHGMLSASEWAPLRLSELARQVIHSAWQMIPHDKHMSVDVAPSPVMVTADQAHNLALVINELATNTIKHTLQERDTAQITVRTRLDGDKVLLEFRDDGMGYPEDVLHLERHSVGLDLVQNIVRKSLRGELSLHNDHGAVTTMHIKAEAK